ncbi:MAG: glycine cleavage system aminomethyltransferase GcvT [Nitrospiraceae bacterium]
MARTPLYDAHVAAGGRLVDFAGWDMPMQYSGVLDEYHAVRTKAGLFDVSHMGRISVTGAGALDFLQRVTTNDVATIAVGQAQYGMVCTESGGIKDDIFVYRLADRDYLVCVNASNREKIVAWFHQHNRKPAECVIVDPSADMAQVAVQGPASRAVLGAIGLPDATTMKLRHCAVVTLMGAPCTLARTGYTGELGFELYFPAKLARQVWDRVLLEGQAHGVKPAGLGARDLLRLEMAYLLYGNDMSEETTPLEAGAAWAVALHKPNFIGRTALLAQNDALPRRLIGFELLEKAVPRHGCLIRRADGDGGQIGEVTSGNLSPLLQKGIGMGYVPMAHTAVGSRLVIDIRGKLVPAVVVKPPFYSHKRPAST